MLGAYFLTGAAANAVCGLAVLDGHIEVVDILARKIARCRTP